MVTAKALFTMKMDANRETLAAFSLRSQSALREANWKDGPAIAMLCLIALPKSLSHDIFVAYHSRKQDHSRPQTAQEVLSLATKINQQKRSLDSDDETHSDGKAKKSRTTKDASRYNHTIGLQIKLSGWIPQSQSSHTSENCRVLHPELANNSPRDSKSSPGNAVKSRSSAPTTANTTGSIRLCWYCNKAPYSKQHMCDERKKAIAAKSNVRSIKTAKHPADQSIDHLHDNMQAIRLQAFDGSMDTGKTPLKYNINMITDLSHRANKPYIFPLLLQNSRAYALLDTEADVSVISRSFIEVNKILIQPNSTCLNLAGKDNTLLTYGKSSPILVSFNNVTLKHQFEVIDLDDEDRIDCYIGDDLINLFNITVSNIPCHWPDQKLESTKENHNIDNPPEPNNSPAGTPEDHQEFMQAIQPYTDKNQTIPKTSFCPLDISIIRLETPTIPTNRTNHRQYPIALTLQPLVDEAVATWKAEGTIVDAPIDTTWNSPITLAPKKDEHGNVTGHRPCLDPRHINKHLPDDVYPLPLIKDIFESMHGATVFTTLDLKSAFHRFMIHPDDQHKTTFTHKGRQYMFQGAPFGLKPLSAKFQRVMHAIFNGLPYVQTFIDDVVVYSPDLQTHTTHVITAIQRLTDANLILNPKKCHWAQTAVYLLGFCISNYGYDLDHRKVCNVLEWSRPTSGHGVQQFLGIFNYFRAHLPNAAAMTAPLDALRNKEAITDEDWTPLHEKHFLLIKQQLQMNTILHYPDPNLPFYVATDASNYGIGAALYQIINDQERFIGYMARSLSPSERNYNTTKRELLAIVFALKKFHKYLWGNPFTLYTDHRALTYIHTQTIASPMMINWLDTILDYSFTIVHKPGDLNIFPDLLSRLDTPSQKIHGGKYHHIQATKLRRSQSTSNDPSSQRVHLGVVRSNSRVCAIQSMKVDYITPPAQEHKSILQRIHAFGHFGAEAIIKTAHKEGLHWTNLAKEALAIVQQCPSCQRYNITKKGYNSLRPIYAYLPDDHWAIDLAGPFEVSLQGNTWLLVMVDVCTRFTILRVLQDKKSDTIIHTLIQVFGDFGYPNIVQSDNGKEFKNNFFTKLQDTMGIDHRFSTSYHPRGNGVAERYVRTAKEIIRKEIQGTRKDWDWFVPNAQLAMNHLVSKRLQTPPFSLMFARHMNAPYILTQHDKTTTKRPITYEELTERLEYMADVVFPAIKERTQTVIDAQKEAFDKSHKLVDFPIGSFVVARLPTRKNKLAPIYDGPYEVMQKTTNGNYLLKDMTGALTSRNYHYGKKNVRRRTATYFFRAQKNLKYAFQNVLCRIPW
ncbi:hypothetical protein [Absidia glauca]|uniref:Reverse transcriptase n=2 Tax=Absidia glauca TaxID=4829 RepID=A0A163MFG0_ABSGL|nr:hypothetical protein [Absidia glauca]